MTKCIVHECKNHRHEGRFVGELCGPCHTILTTGKITPSSAWFVVEIERLREALTEIATTTYHSVDDYKERAREALGGE